MREHDLINSIISNIEMAILGKRTVIRQMISAIIADGHVLVEDVPGVGKTTLVKALAKSMDLTFNRVQFTPDVLPSDITGISVYNQKSMEFEFKRGPVFTNVLLCDEINRTSPKTQSALLEVMEEYHVTEGDTTYNMKKPFFVLATENTVEHSGTYELPEAQLDRFMININIGYPSNENEIRILELYRSSNPLNELKPIVSREDILSIQEKVKEIYVSKEINQYIINIVDKTRNTNKLALGVSTRGALALLRIAQASAFMDGRDYVIPEDVKNNLNLVLAHRIKLSLKSKSEKYSREDILQEIKASVKPPRIENHV